MESTDLNNHQQNSRISEADSELYPRFTSSAITSSNYKSSYIDKNLIKQQSYSLKTVGYSDIHRNKQVAKRMNFHKYSKSLISQPQKPQICDKNVIRVCSQSKSAKKNDEIIFNRLEKDLEDICDSNIIMGLTNGKINFDDFVNIMFHLGFIVWKSTTRTPFAEAEVSEKENKFLLKIWRHLRGKYRGYISLDNIKVYLSAILNLELSFMFAKHNLNPQWNISSNTGNYSGYLSPCQVNSEISGLSAWNTESNIKNPLQNATELLASNNKSQKKTSFKSVGIFTTKGRFYFKNRDEIKKIYLYYKFLSEQRYRYTTETPRNFSQTLTNTKSKTKLFYQDFTKGDEESSEMYFGKTFYEKSKERNSSRSRARAKNQRWLEKVKLMS